MLLRHKAFRQLFAGRILSVFADSILFFSLLKWIEIKSGGTESFTFFYVAYYLPIVLLALPAGAWISGKTLQHVMAWSNVVRMIGMILFFFFSDLIPMPWVYVLLITESIVGLFFMPANQSLLPQIVSERERPSANSWLQMGYTVVKNIRSNFYGLYAQKRVPACFTAAVLSLSSSLLADVHYAYEAQGETRNA
ncbi:MFS transporter [Paenibacillus sp. NAIST15-1]|uniref:MFS transporter n=1 Tax=Paenibacillus sp. NAIST15-1 TaxID=1605994 RepID=UPI00086A35F7|nr:MFS transporter [Paenibacillus sp. NAIST15-1]GAV13143.1 hypothetical protein PBN151_3076 [Paenibacillus sp. NAIST15-1]